MSSPHRETLIMQPDLVLAQVSDTALLGVINADWWSDVKVSGFTHNS